MLSSSLNSVYFFMVGGSEGEQAEGSDVILTKEKKSIKKVKSVSHGKRLKKGKKLSYRKESDKEKQEYGKRLSEDRESVPLGVQNDDEESSSEGRGADQSRGTLREDVNGKEESGSEGNQKESDAESSPRKVKKLLTELASPHDNRIPEASDNELLVNNSAFA